VLWYQGESDAWSTDGKADRYEQAFLNLIDGIRRDIANPELPIIYVQLGHFALRADAKTSADWEKVRDVQRRVSDERKNVYMVSAIDLSTDDAIHLSFESQQRMGSRLAEVALTEVYHQPGHGKPIKLSSIAVIQPDSERPMIRVHFSGVTGHLKAAGPPTGFELRPSGPGGDPLHMVYRVDFDPHDPAALIVGVFHPFKKGEVDELVYGSGMIPYVNIRDEKDMPVPAFGPIEVKPY
jgi:hypothetical protein